MLFLLNLAQSSLIQICVFGCFLMGLYYFSFYNDGEQLRKEIKGVKTQIQGTQKKVEETQTQIDNNLTFKSELEKQQEVIKALLNYTPNTLTFNEISILINNEALSSGVNIESKRDVSVTDVPDKEYQTLNLDIALTSSFSQLMFFLSKLTQQKRILIVESIDVKVDPAKDLVSANIKILAYRYKAKKKQEDNKNQKGA